MSPSRIAERGAAYSLQAAMEPALSASFDLLATAPQGVAKLRDLILSLAVCGKLLAQDKRDEPASLLMERIHRQTNRPAPTMSFENVPHGWVRTSFGDVVNELCTGPFGSLISKGEYLTGGVPLVNPSHMHEGFIVEDRSIAVSPQKAESLKAYELSPGDIVFARRGNVGRNAIVQDHQRGWLCGTGSFFAKLHDDLCRPFVQLVFNSREMRRYLVGSAVGATMVNLNQRVLLLAPMSIPPLAEQLRIVARVEELMQLCDALEAHGQLQDEQHARLVATLFDALAASASAEELAENWQRIATHFDLLLDRPEAVDALEQTLLQLAARGLLVPQDSADEPASMLLTRIRAEKDRLAAEGQFKRDKPIAPVSDEMAPFDVRSGWEWVPFGELVNISSGITLGRKTTPSKPVTLPYLRVANVQRWHLDLDDLKIITVGEDELPRFLLQRGDLLLTEGGDWDKVGRTCTWQGAVKQCLHQNHVFKARGVLPEWSPAWAELYLNSAYARTYFAGASKQTTNLASINSTQLKSCPFPLPPLAEQHRIVARVEQLRGLCAELRERLQQSRATQSCLAEALMAQIA